MTTVEERMLIEDTLYRYASCIDSANPDGLVDVLHPDLWAQYGNAEPAEGADTVIGWIRDATKACVWQHHLLSVYHVDVQGDRATALVYHTSYQKFEGDDDVCLLVGRYHDELTLHEGTWKISRLVFEIMWGERRADTAGYLSLGRRPGPAGAVLAVTGDVGVPADRLGRAGGAGRRAGPDAARAGGAGRGPRGRALPLGPLRDDVRGGHPALRPAADPGARGGRAGSWRSARTPTTRWSVATVSCTASGRAESATTAGAARTTTASPSTAGSAAAWAATADWPTTSCCPTSGTSSRPTGVPATVLAPLADAGLTAYHAIRTQA